MEDCIFCKIARNEENCYCVYEDEDVKAFLDINPWTEGHTLVISKKHYKDIFEIPEKEFNKIMLFVRKLSVVYREIFDHCDINIISSNGRKAQQDVFHFHIHVIPRYTSDKQKIELKVNESLKRDIQKTFNKINAKNSLI